MNLGSLKYELNDLLVIRKQLGIFKLNKDKEFRESSPEGASIHHQWSRIKIIYTGPIKRFFISSFDELSMETTEIGF